MMAHFKMCNTVVISICSIRLLPIFIYTPAMSIKMHSLSGIKYNRSPQKCLDFIKTILNCRMIHLMRNRISTLYKIAVNKI